MQPVKVSDKCFVCLSSFVSNQDLVKKHLLLLCLLILLCQETSIVLSLSPPLSPPSDYKVGFGGKFGVQTDRQDKSAAGWDHVEKVEKHESQVDHKKGFGGKYGVGVQDKSAVGWEHHEKVEKHESQKGGLCTSALICLHIFSHLFCFLCMFILLHIQDYKTGFGGQFGVQKDSVDASAAGWDHVEKVPKHPSQQGRSSPPCGEGAQAPQPAGQDPIGGGGGGSRKGPKAIFSIHYA